MYLCIISLLKLVCIYEVGLIILVLLIVINFVLIWIIGFVVGFVWFIGVSGESCVLKLEI